MFCHKILRHLVQQKISLKFKHTEEREHICYIKILTMQSITSFLQQNFDDRKILDYDQLVLLEAVWKHWKEVGFPDQHLLLIICVGCLVMENSRKRNVSIPISFLDEFT